eukprot:2034746-Heterocapsa_arctica.AAC.1
MFKQQVGRERQFPSIQGQGMYKANRQSNVSNKDYRGHTRNGYEKKFHKRINTIVQDHRDEHSRWSLSWRHERQSGRVGRSRENNTKRTTISCRIGENQSWAGTTVNTSKAKEAWRFLRKESKTY